MVREIIKDPDILTKKSEPFIFGRDDHIIQDMLDTTEVHKESCVGLAAIQIGEPKRVILVRQGDKFVQFINPTIVKKSPNTYYTMEGCLSMEGARNVKRHRSVMVSWTTTNGKNKVKTFEGFTAQILQHEIDHLNGVLI